MTVPERFVAMLFLWSLVLLGWGVYSLVYWLIG